MADRSVLATVLGVPPVAAVALGAVLTAVGVFVDLVRVGSLGLVFTICYITGCVLAVAWVRRDGLFGPMVQPPLLVAVAVPVVVLLAGSPKPGAGVAERLLVVGAPLVNAFPTMAWTTGIVLALGVVRLVVQRPLDAGPPETAGQRPAELCAARAGRSSRGSENVRVSSAVVTSSMEVQPRSARWSSTPRTSTSGTDAPLVSPIVPTPSSQLSSISRA